jgi:hypothetical protein
MHLLVILNNATMFSEKIKALTGTKLFLRTFHGILRQTSLIGASSPAEVYG